MIKSLGKQHQEITHLITIKIYHLVILIVIFRNEQLADKKIYIEIEKKKYPAELLTKPLKANNFKNI
jgi:hypothetical protein